MNRIILLFLLFSTVSVAKHLPRDFVYLRDVDPSIIQEIRYAGNHNFVGRPVKGYQAAECILTKKTATALSKVQQELLQSGLSLKVYDCYRPQRAVDDFISWSKDPKHQETKKEFYPTVNKKDFFIKGYVVEKSGHTRGSTVDLTVVSLPLASQTNYTPGQSLVACNASHNQRFADNSIDMGTGFDCFDSAAHVDNMHLCIVAIHHRAMFHALMYKYGFKPYPKEWWHFTPRNEPYPNTYFDFPVSQRQM